MIPVSVNPNFIPQDILSSWSQATQAALAALLQTPGITLGHLEELLEAQARKLMLPILSAAAHALAALQPFVCHHCQEPLRVED